LKQIAPRQAKLPMKSFLQLSIYCLLLPALVQAQLFQDDFGTAFGSIDAVKWPCATGSSFNTSIGSCAGSGDYIYYIDNNKILASRSIFVPASGYCLNFSYTYNSSLNLPRVQIGTGGSSCSSFSTSWTDVATLSQAASCSPMSISLDAYAGQTIYVRFLAGNSFTDFELDDIIIDNSGCSGGGGGGPSGDFKWADNFNDNDLTLDYAGNDGDETCPTCGQWNLGAGASLELVPSSSWNGNTNETEAFPAGMSNVYYVKLDRDEYIESPTIDLSGQESFKISFYAKSSSSGSGGGDSWSSFSDHLRLQIWDGSSWITVKDITEGTSTLENKISPALPFNYFCFTAYKSNSSPGNYYYNSAPNVDANYFHSDFKFRVIFEDGFSGAPFAWVDDFTFRADADGYSTMIPCGISFWNEPLATGYGQDPDATASDHSERGVNLELDNSINFPPNWAAEANDGDQVDQIFGGGESERVVFAVISEQEINFAFPKVFFYSPDDGWNSATLSIDNNYTGPGWRYYSVQYISCDLTSSSIAEPTDDYRYYYVFEYGNEFIPVFYHLNRSGIETGGGATSSFEVFNAPDVTSTDDCGLLPIELLSFEGELLQQAVALKWQTATELNFQGFEIQRSLDGIVFEPLGSLAAQGSEGLGASYEFMDPEALSLGKNTLYYRLKELDLDGSKHYSPIIAVELPPKEANGLQLYPNPVSDRLFWRTDGSIKFLAYEIRDALGRVLMSDQIQGNSIDLSSLAKGQYFIRFKDEDGFSHQKILIKSNY
jgi:hypothetical protein